MLKTTRLKNYFTNTAQKFSLMQTTIIINDDEFFF